MVPPSASVLGSGARCAGPQGRNKNLKITVELVVRGPSWPVTLTSMGANVRIGVLTFVTDEGIGPAELGVGAGGTWV